MSARRSSQPAVQLFPFLAVLMCALGALILILLVTTTRIRDQVRARASSSIANSSVAVDDPTPTAGLAVPPRTEWKPLAAPPPVSLKPIAESAAPTLPAPPAPTLRDQWQQTVADLATTAAQEEAAVQARRAAAKSAEAGLQTTTTQLASLQRDAESLARSRSAAEAELQRAQRREGELRRAIAERETEFEQKETQLREAESRFSILPYDGRTGTVRRPIYIECTETGLTFASEGITLTPDQLNGFSSLQNPLRAGADALIDYWSLKGMKDASSHDAGAPYVLLVVRPRGTVAYYVARRMLESLGQQFGYELIPDQLAIHWPESEDGAVKSCRAAIDAMLRNRDRFVLRGNVPGKLAPLSVTDGQGRFALEEVEKLRGSGRMVHFGGQTFDRDAAHRRSASTSTAYGHSRSRSTGHPPRTTSESSRDPAEGRARGGARLPLENGVNSTGSPARSAMADPRSTAAGGVSESATSAWSGRRTSAANRGTGDGAGDPTPRPLPSLDAKGSTNQPQTRQSPRNPTDVLHDPGSQIGLERKVIVRIEPRRVVVESETAIAVSAVLSREELQAELAEALQTLFASWGRPPRGFYWLPQVKFSVLPGGQQHVKRLTDLTDEWKIKSEIDFALE